MDKVVIIEKLFKLINSIMWIDHKSDIDIDIRKYMDSRDMWEYGVNIYPLFKVHIFESDIFDKNLFLVPDMADYILKELSND